MKAQQTWSTPVRKEAAAAIPCAVCGASRFIPALHCEGYAYVRCASCGLVQINPQPERAAVHNRYDEKYFQYELENEANFFQLGRLALEDAGIAGIEAEAKTRKTALEIGCATGMVLAYLRERGWETQGVEISESEARYAAETRGLDVSTLPLEENHFPAGHFFLVTASHLIEHLNEPALFIREVRRILMPEGVFLITTPNIAGLQARLFGAKWRSAIFDHLYLFSRATLTRLLTQEGFTIERIVTWGGIAQGFAPRPVKRVLDSLAKRMGFGDVMLIKCRAAKAKERE